MVVVVIVVCLVGLVVVCLVAVVIVGHRQKPNFKVWSKSDQ